MGLAQLYTRSSLYKAVGLGTHPEWRTGVLARPHFA